jgi:translation initiation factor IF-2
LAQEKVRVYVLARELNVPTKDLLELCQQAGMDVKNQLSGLDPDQRDLVEQLVKRRQSATGGAASAPRPAGSVLPPVTKVIKNLDTHRARPEPSRTVSPPATTQPAAPSQPAASAAQPGPESPPAPSAPVTPTPTTRPPTPAPSTRPAAVTPDSGTPPVAPAAQGPADTGASRGQPPGIGGVVRKVPDLGSRPRDGGPRRTPPPPLRQTGGPGTATPPPKLRPSLAERIAGKKPPEPQVAKPIAKLTKEILEASHKQPITPEMVLRSQGGVAEVAPPADLEEEEAAGRKKAGALKRQGPGTVGDRTQRRKERERRAEARKVQGGVAVVEGRLIETEDDTERRRGVLLKRRPKSRPLSTQPRKAGKVVLEPPLTVRALSEGLGLKALDLIFKLKRDHGMANATINTSIEPQLAEEIALESGQELEIRRAPDAEDRLLAGFDQPDGPDDLVPRAPVVTIMGHVDHGKTSLLDRIRQSNVVASEAGGITQVLRAWRVQHHGKLITFLDTPGHEAFTKMRARGAQVTDIAVIVVAADDGVMPQTEEAISHAKAANVSLVVAINKVDLPSANVNRTRQQLYGLSVLPDNMGGDTPFVETSAATGKGIDELLEAISLVAELKELKANPHKPGRGTCLEAMLSEGEGVRATLLVRDGSLHKGDVILCGATYGRVRQMYDDLGRPLQEAGPSVPVRITGLDAVPNADDPFVVALDLATAREIADKRKTRHQEASLVKRVPLSLESLTQAQVAELKVILKADFRGSVEAIRKELEKLQHEEVRVRVLHAAIGGITESDVQLALTSPEDTIIVGFNVVPDDRAMALAEEKGISIRQYDIIYNLTNDIRAALEGKLKPREEVVHLGRAVVRETFKISRVGTIAGCYVTQGVIRRSGKVRVIREGVVIYPPPDRTASLESLKRFKDDAAEVREGFECGLKIAGYDDVKVGDVIECYHVEEVQRKFEPAAGGGMKVR